MNQLLNPRGWLIATAALLALHLWGRHEWKHPKGDR